MSAIYKRMVKMIKKAYPNADVFESEPVIDNVGDYLLNFDPNKYSNNRTTMTILYDPEEDYSEIYDEYMSLV